MTRAPAGKSRSRARTVVKSSQVKAPRGAAVKVKTEQPPPGVPPSKSRQDKYTISTSTVKVKSGRQVKDRRALASSLTPLPKTQTPQNATPNTPAPLQNTQKTAKNRKITRKRQKKSRRKRNKKSKKERKTKKERKKNTPSPTSP
jgi:hypothetical protein